jgi:hypothetical protein
VSSRHGVVLLEAGPPGEVQGFTRPWGRRSHAIISKAVCATAKLVAIVSLSPPIPFGSRRSGWPSRPRRRARIRSCRVALWGANIRSQADLQGERALVDGRSVRLRLIVREDERPVP